MKYRLVELEITNPPEALRLSDDEEGFGLVFRDRDRIVGFRLVDAKELGPARCCVPAAYVSKEVRIAAEAERLHDQFGREHSGMPLEVTVAICSKDGWARVDRLLGSLEALGDAPSFEILVVENAPRDERMRALCEGRGGVRYVAEHVVGLDFARNRALREAKGDVVAFLDDDVTVDRTWLAGLQRAWRENPDAGCVTGLVLPLALDTEARILFEHAGGFRRGSRALRSGAARHRDHLHPCGAGKFGAGANMSVRRTLALELGGFDEALDTGAPLPGGGDIDMFYRVLRAGAMLVYEPQMVVYHEHRRELAQLQRQFFTWGLGLMAFVSKSMQSDPAMRGPFYRLIAWWFRRQASRLVDRARGREPIPARMLLAETWGGVVGLCGAYRRSQHRSAALRRREA